MANAIEIVSRCSDEKLFIMIDHLYFSSIPEDSPLRKIAREVYETNNETLIQMMSLAIPISRILAERYKELRNE